MHALSTLCKLAGTSNEESGLTPFSSRRATGVDELLGVDTLITDGGGGRAGGVVGTAIGVEPGILGTGICDGQIDGSEN